MLKKSVIISTLILSLVLLPFSSLSASASTVNSIDYNDYVTNVEVDGENDIVTVSLPLDWCFHSIKTSAENTFYQYQGSSVTLDVYNTNVGTILWTDQIFILGNRYINADDIPSGTVITYNLVVNVPADKIKYPASDNATYNAQVKSYAAARDKDLNVLTWNYVATRTVGLISGQECSISAAFNKPSGTRYFQPLVQLEFYDMWIEPFDLTIDLRSVDLTFSISSLQRLQTETGKTNKLLQKIIEADPDILNRAEDTHSKTEENISKADEIIDILDEQSYPDEQSLADATDTFDIVTQSNIQDYTSILSDILNAEIIRNMLILGVSLALISLVLFGKKK